MLDLRGRPVVCALSTSSVSGLEVVLGLSDCWFSLSSTASTAIAVAGYWFSSLKMEELRVDRLGRLEGSSSSAHRRTSVAASYFMIMPGCSYPFLYCYCFSSSFPKW
jgi:hypothetical protein